MEQIDTLKNSGYKIIQDKEKFMFGIDAVLLASYATIRKNEKIFDLCTGNGIVPLLMHGKSKEINPSFAAIEIQKDSAEMAKKSVEINGLENQIKIVHGDLKNVGSIFKRHSFDVVTCNPPYMLDEHGKQTPNEYKRIARHEVLCNLNDVISAAEYLLKPNGRFYMIHRPFRLVEIFSTLIKFKLEPKKMRLVQPFLQREPNMVLIEAKKNAASRLAVEKPLIVYEKPGLYTQEILQIYENL